MPSVAVAQPQIEVLGIQSFLGKQIPIIEGGFGESEKVVLAKTIAEIHEVELRVVNQLINENIEEFEEDIDIIDLKNSISRNDPLLELGFTKQSIANSKNIYLLSEQGYMALVSLMRTDKAKELRKMFRREYFSMRREKREDVFYGLSKELQAIFAIDKKQQELDERIETIEDKMTVNYELAENLRTAVNIRAVELLGGKDSEAYKKLNKKLFSSFHRDIKRTFKVNSYKNLSVKNYDIAMEFISKWYPKDEVLTYAIHGLNSQLSFT